jgi:F-type H+-transporting ATPase subunit delta
VAGSGVFAPRYAHAFADVVTSKGLDAQAAQGQMQSFAELLAGSHDLREVLENPSIPAEQKLGVIDAIAERLGMMREVRNFIAVIMDHQRLGELKEIIAAYDAVADAGKGVKEVEVTSAHELNKDDRQELEFEISKLVVSRIKVTYGIDSSLIGGAVVKVGSTVYDGSVKTQLEQLKQTLVSA